MGVLPWSGREPGHDLCAKVGSFSFDVIQNDQTKLWRWQLTNGTNVRSSGGYYDTRDEAENAINKVATEMELI